MYEQIPNHPHKHVWGLASARGVAMAERCPRASASALLQAMAIMRRRHYLFQLWMLSEDHGSKKLKLPAPLTALRPGLPLKAEAIAPFSSELDPVQIRDWLPRYIAPALGTASGSRACC